jgi:lysophospholipase L1-like esterase
MSATTSVTSAFCLALTVAVGSQACGAEHSATHVGPLRVIVIGDSTVCDFPAKNPCRGWGQYLQEHFKDSVKIINLAVSGRSTKTFIQEGRWKQALGRNPDYVLIQFGHNDSHGPDRPESTDAATVYKDYLCRYVDDCRAIGAKPILITPMHRRTFDGQGRLEDNLRPYATAMKEVAAEKKVALIDLHAMSGELFLSLGDVGSMTLASTAGDHTHFNEKGARAMAGLVLQMLPKVMPDLAKEMRTVNGYQ